MITVIGYDGDPLSDEARDRVADAELVVGGARHLAALPQGTPTREWASISEGWTVAMTNGASGDSIHTPRCVLTLNCLPRSA